MELEQTMLLMARTWGRTDLAGDLNEAVRTGILNLVAMGTVPPGLAAEDAADLENWAASVRQVPGDPAGALYQELLRREVVRTQLGLTVQAARTHHRQSGAYYTIDPLVRYMVSRARSLHPAATSLIDPACGIGAFLQVAREMYEGGLSRISGWDTDPAALAVCRSRLPAADLAVRDALLAESDAGYDLCLGNPPYISSGLRGAVAHSPERLQSLRQRFPESAEYKLNTYPLFIQRGLELLRPGGVLGFVVPDSFLTGRYFAGLRRLLLRYTLVELTLIQKDFWAHGRVGQSVILFVRKEAPPAGHRVRIRVCPEPESLTTGSWEEVPLEEVSWGPLHRFRLVTDPATRQILQQMERNAYPLSQRLRTYSGLIGRRGQSSLICSRDEEGNASRELGRLLRSGREIDRYTLHWAGTRVRLDPTLIKSGGNRAYYEQPKILLRQTADSLRAVYDDQGYYCLNNVHLLVPARSQTNLRALLGLINSAPFGRFYQAVAMEAGRLYAQVDLDLLGSLPVPDLAAPGIDSLERLVRQRENAALNKAALFESQIDTLVEQLYGLG